MRPCCQEHVNAGDPNGCRRYPKDDIAKKKLAEFAKFRTQHGKSTSERYFASRGMLPISYPNNEVFQG